MHGPPVTVLVVDDEVPIRRAVRHALAESDPPIAARVTEAGTGEAALAHAAAERPALIVLDLGLPDMDGRAVLRDLRAWSGVPVLVLSARHADTEKAELLDGGADDYLTKPFSVVELQARVRALLRRSARASAAQRDGAAGDAAATDATRFTAGDLVVDFERRLVERAGVPVHLTPIEWSLLTTLVAHADRPLTHRQLFTAVWPGRAYGDAQAYLRVHVAHLRRKLEADPVRPRHLKTEAGVGYRFAL
ncbi:MAG TPA: response regulator [Gemmatirosa sp.]